MAHLVTGSIAAKKKIVEKEKKKTGFEFSIAGVNPARLHDVIALTWRARARRANNWRKLDSFYTHSLCRGHGLKKKKIKVLKVRRRRRVKERKDEGNNWFNYTMPKRRILSLLRCVPDPVLVKPILPKKNTGDSKGVPLWEAHKIFTFATTLD